jgi:hypothetical protein
MEPYWIEDVNSVRDGIRCMLEMDEPNGICVVPTAFRELRAQRLIKKKF